MVPPETPVRLGEKGPLVRGCQAVATLHANWEPSDWQIAVFIASLIGHWPENACLFKTVTYGMKVENLIHTLDSRLGAEAQDEG